MEAADADPSLKSAPAEAPLPVVEIGWVFASLRDEAQHEAARQARLHAAKVLRATFPGYAWRFPTVERPVDASGPVEPMLLLDLGSSEREARQWDFALVVTGSELVSYYKPYTLGTPSKALATAALSLSRLDVDALGDADEPDVERLGRRAGALALHLIGDLCSVPHADGPEQFMTPIASPMDLDARVTYAPDSLSELVDDFDEASDARLEETLPARISAAAFYLKAATFGLRDIGEGIREVEPWRFPLRLSKLTLASVSTLLVLLITAEAWDLGMLQPQGRVTAFALAALGGTSLYLLHRQKLLQRRGRARTTEQVAVANLTIGVSVLVGMATTFVLLFGLALAVSLAFFPDEVVATWAGSLQEPAGWDHYLRMAGFNATLGLLIGALGASFEEEAYFRHVTYVDEEV